MLAIRRPSTFGLGLTNMFHYEQRRLRLWKMYIQGAQGN